MDKELSHCEVDNHGPTTMLKRNLREEPNETPVAFLELNSLSVHAVCAPFVWDQGEQQTT